MPFSEDPRRILLIRPSALGDACRTVPVLVSLRARYPSAEIDWLIQDDFAAVIAHHPALTRPILFPRRAVAIPRLWRPTAARTLLDFLDSLRRARYDLVIDCQGLGRSGFFAFVTRAPVRIGYADAAELGHLGLNRRYRIPRDLHSVDRMLALIEHAGITPIHDMRLYTSPAERDAARRLVPAERFALIAPTARWPGKRWPAERFAQLARALLDHIDAVVLVGGRNERDQCGPLIELARADPRVIDLIGRTSVGELMALVERAALVIANDSAPVHLAVGFDRPLVALYGPTRLDLVGPYRRERDAIQAVAPSRRNVHKDESAGRAAMLAIAAQSVIDAALARLMPRCPTP